MRTDQATDHALLEFFQQIEADAEQIRSPFLSERDECMAFYMNYVSQPIPDGLEWMSPEMLADAFMLVESWLPGTVGTTLGGSSFVVNSDTMQGYQVQQAIERSIRQMRRKSEFDLRTVDAMRMLGIGGHLHQKNVWVEAYGDKRTAVFSDPTFDANGQQVSAGNLVDFRYEKGKTFAGPMTFYPDPQNVWKSAATDVTGRPLAYVERMEMNLDHMVQFDKSYREETGEPFYRNLDKLSAFRGRKDVWDGSVNRGFGKLNNAGYSGKTRMTDRELTSGLSEEILGGTDAVFIKHGWARVPERIKRYNDTQYRLVVYGPGPVILRDVPAPSSDLRAPMREIFLMRVGNEPYGRSPLRWTLGEVEQRSQMRTLRLAESWLNIVKPRVANRNANWDHNDFINKPGAIWFYDHDTLTPQQAIGDLPRSPMLPEVYREDALMENHINRVFGSTPSMQGEGLGSRATKFEAQLVDVRAGSRSDLTGRMVAWQAERGAMKDYFDLFRTFGEDPIMVQVDGEQGSIPVKVLAQEIDFGVDIDINAEEFGMMNEQILAGMVQALGLFYSVPELASQLDPRKVVSRYMHRTGVDDIMRSRDEADQMMQMQMMAQAQQASAPPAA